jgi:hypothetical protein
MQRLSRDTVAAGGRHAKAEEVHAEEEVHTEDRQEGGASEGAHGRGLGGLSWADHQMPADGCEQGVVGVKSDREIATALLEPVKPIPALSCARGMDPEIAKKRAPSIP